MLKTPFWKSAAASLPAHIRRRYARDFERAERWELAFDAALKALSRAKQPIVRVLKPAHG